MKAKTEDIMAPVSAEVERMKILQKAKYENDITVLLRPWFSYRLYVRFLKPHYDPKTGTKKTAIHRFGHEHNCSYNQLVHGHVQNIFLDKLAGYANCIAMAEETFKGKYYHATIYARQVFPDGKFDIICRHYDRSGIKDIADPVIEPSHNRTLYLQNVVGGFIDVSPEPVEQASAIDFHALVTQQLK